jgi:hypothetical protein
MVETARTSSIALIEGATEFNEKSASATGELRVPWHCFYSEL